MVVRLVEVATEVVVCQDPRGVASKGLWLQHNPLEYTTPLLLLQLSVISLTARLIQICLKPLGQSSIVSQIFGGVVFGPSLLGHGHLIFTRLFPARGTQIIETAATFGLMFFFFLIGVKTDSGMILRPEPRALIIGMSIMLLSVGLTAPLALLLKKYLPMDASLAESLPLLAVSQCLTPFPDIICLLEELKILNSDLGRLATSSSLVCFALGVSMTAIAFSVVAASHGHTLSSLWSIFSSIALFAGIVFAVRPIISWILTRIPPGKNAAEAHVMFLFTAVLATGFISEIIGQHFVLGPLLLGLAVPTGPPLGSAMTLKLESLVSGVLYPTFLTLSGLKTNVHSISLRSSLIMTLIVVFASLIKIVAVLLPAYFCNVPTQDAVVLGLMLNARGICELTVYCLWRGHDVLTDQEFALSVIAVIAVTAIITPLIRLLYNPSKQRRPIKRRTIQHAKRESELRILVCIHNQDRVPTTINVLEASNATIEQPIAVIAVQLVELVGRATPVLVAHQQARPRHTLDSSASKSNHIINAFRHYELYNQGCVSVQSFSAISRFNTMHEDICRLALDQSATIAIVPFHRQWAIDGRIDSTHRGIQTMTTRVLDGAPCSVGILVDRGILSGSLSIVNDAQSDYHVAVVYLGGPDDSEALCYGARMAKHPKVTLMVLRFLLFGGDNARQRKLDNDLINEIRQDNVGNQGFVYKEEVVRDGVGLASSIRGLEHSFDLMLVGRHHEDSPLLFGLDAWSECPELGVVGDLLASPDFGTTASVLVVQQQVVGGKLISRSVKHVVHDMRESLLNNAQRLSAATATSPGSKNNNKTWTISVDR